MSRGMAIKYNTQCPAHAHICWAHRHLMREDDFVCTPDYKRLPPQLRHFLWRAKEGIDTDSYVSLVVDWLLEHPLPEDVECNS
jgi:hypothetical protein